MGGKRIVGIEVVGWWDFGDGLVRRWCEWGKVVGVVGGELVGV